MPETWRQADPGLRSPADLAIGIRSPVATTPAMLGDNWTWPWNVADSVALHSLPPSITDARLAALDAMQPDTLPVPGGWPAEVQELSDGLTLSVRPERRNERSANPDAVSWVLRRSAAASAERWGFQARWRPNPGEAEALDLLIDPRYRFDGPRQWTVGTGVLRSPVD